MRVLALGNRYTLASFSLIKTYPPVLPVEGNRKCLKIIKVENGILANLTDIFLGVIVGFAFLAGTIVSFCSASYMVWWGQQFMLRNWFGPFFFGVLHGLFGEGGGVRVMHGIPVVIGGTDSTSVIRKMAKIEEQYKQIMICKHSGHQGH